MRAISVENQSALAARRLRARDFLWLTARDRETGDPVSVGFWSGLSNVTADVLDPDTDEPVTRAWYGVGALIEVSDIPAVIGVSTNDITVRMDQMDAEVNEAIRLYDCKQAGIQLFRGMFDPDSGKLVAPGFCRFVGFVDRIEVKTPAEGESGYAELTCVSHTQELLRGNPTTRSNEDQKRRSATDNFFADAAVVGTWGPKQWGPKQETINATPPPKQGLFGWGNLFGFL